MAKKFSELKAGDDFYVWHYNTLHKYIVKRTITAGKVLKDIQEEVYGVAYCGHDIVLDNDWRFTVIYSDEPAMVYGTDGWHEYLIIGTSKEAVKECLEKNLEADKKKLEEQTKEWLLEFGPNESDELSDEVQEIIAALATEDGECRAFKEAKANNAAYIIEDGWIVRVYADNHTEKIKYVGETTVKINNDEKDVLPKIKGWVARDDDLNHIHLFHNKPLRSKWTWACGYPALQLPDSFMPELKWEDEPVEVELIINKI